MAYKEFVTRIHKKTQRDYVARVNEFPKAEAAKICKGFGREYWDGDRKFGYGGYRYDGRWRIVAEVMAKEYGLKKGDRVLDVGCGKGFLLYDLTQVVPGIEIEGIDISDYAIQNAKEEVKQNLKVGTAAKLPYPDQYFDFVYSINTLHNLECRDFYNAMKEIERVGKCHKYICVESWRNEEEKANLLYWQITCQMFCSVDTWLWWFQHTQYSGDHEFIFFE
jgi:protein-L-isoaspartate(D-aspartate) O-methyltransferase